MDAPKNKPSSLASTIRWVARIFCILAIVFIGMWSVEAVEGKVGLGRQILGFLMAPPFLLSVVLIIILIIAWKHELVGGILIALIGLATAVFISTRRGMPFDRRSLQTVATINVPFIIVGVLFIISYFLHRPKKLTTQIP